MSPCSTRSFSLRVALAVAPNKRRGLLITGTIWALAVLLAQVLALLLRGQGYRALHLALFPAQQLLLFGAWGRGATKRTLEWHGRAFRLSRDCTLEPQAPRFQP